MGRGQGAGSLSLHPPDRSPDRASLSGLHSLPPAHTPNNRGLWAYGKCLDFRDPGMTLGEVTPSVEVLTAGLEVPPAVAFQLHTLLHLQPKIRGCF